MAEDRGLEPLRGLTHVRFQDGCLAIRLIFLVGEVGFEPTSTGAKVLRPTVRRFSMVAHLGFEPSFQSSELCDLPLVERALGHVPNYVYMQPLAEREGFEPSRRFTVWGFSKALVSAAHPSFLVHPRGLAPPQISPSRPKRDASAISPRVCTSKRNRTLISAFEERRSVH